MNEHELSEREARITKKAHELWLAEEKPDGRADLHWVMAAEIIATEDNYAGTTIPVSESTKPVAEPEEALANTGEFPTLTDQGEMEIPKRQTKDVSS